MASQQVDPHAAPPRRLAGEAAPDAALAGDGLQPRDGGVSAAGPEAATGAWARVRRAVTVPGRALARRPRLRLAWHVALAVAGSASLALAQASSGQEAAPLFGLFFWCLVVTRTFGPTPALAAVVSAATVANYALLPPRGALSAHGEAGLLTAAFTLSATVAVWMFAAVRRDGVEQRLRVAHEQHLVREHAQLLRALSRALSARDVFLAVAGHELRSPVTAAMMQAQAQQRRQGKLGEAGAEHAKSWQRQVQSLQRLLALVDGLLDVSRINNGQLKLELEEVDLAGVVREVTGRYDEIARRADCALSVDVPPSVVGSFDRLRVEQVVANLLSNAFKYGAGKPVQLRLVPAADDAEAMLQVQDHGAGIAQADKKRIFDCFARSVADKSVAGLGLGLWIVRQIVQAQAGTIEVESELGEGATFTVKLPLRRSVTN